MCFRGDPALSADGMQILAEQSKRPVLGLLAWLPNLGIAEEDSAVLDRTVPLAEQGDINLAVLKIPHIANFDDFDPLAREPGVRVTYVTEPVQIAGADAVILPGTKHTLSSLRWLVEGSFAEALQWSGNQCAGATG